MKKCILLILVIFNLKLVFGQYDNTLIPYRLKDKWGYCDLKGKIKIKPVYEKALLFTIQGFAIIKKNGKYGIIDKNGKYTCKPKFELLSYGKKENNELDYYFVVNYKYSDYSTKHIVNHKGERIMLSGSLVPDRQFGGCIPERRNQLEKGLNSLKNRIRNYEERNKEYYFLNKKYGEGAFFYFKINQDTFIYCFFRDEVGILNIQLNEVVPFKYQRIEEFEGLFKVFTEDNNDDYYGLYSSTGKELLSLHEVLKLNDSSLLLIENGNKFGVFDLKRLAIILPVKYDKIILLKDNKEIKFLVSNHRIYSSSLDYHNFRNYRLINQLNKPITDTVFKEIIMKDNQDSSFFIANTSEGWNKFNLLGKKMFKESYNKLVYSSQNNDSNKSKFEKDFFIVSKFINKGEEKYGVINIDDSIHVPFEFDEIEVCSFKYNLQGFFLKNYDFKNYMLLAKNDNKCGLITIENKIIVPLIYKNIELLENTPFAFVELENGKTGYINYIAGVEYYKD